MWRLAGNPPFRIQKVERPKASPLVRDFVTRSRSLLKPGTCSPGGSEVRMRIRIVLGLSEDNWNAFTAG